MSYESYQKGAETIPKKPLQEAVLALSDGLQTKPIANYGLGEKDGC